MNKRTLQGNLENFSWAKKVKVTDDSAISIRTQTNSTDCVLQHCDDAESAPKIELGDSVAHCDSTATAFCDSNGASPQTPTSTDLSKLKSDDPVQPFLQTFPQRKHGKRFTADLYHLYGWIEYSGPVAPTPLNF